MAGGIGNLTVGLGLDAAEFTRGLTKADAQAQAFARRQEELTASAAKFGAALGLVAVAAASAFVNMVREQAIAIDKFNDLSDATGASIENISALDKVARETGGSFEGVASTLVKFNKALTDTRKDGSEAARVFAAMGLSAADLRREDPAEALRLTAVALSRFADDGEKARAVQVLFGKSIQEAAPFLKDLAEQQKLVAVTTTAGALEVEKFNKELYKAQAASTDFARSITVDVVTAINSLIAKAREGRITVLGLHASLGKTLLEIASFGTLKFRSEEDQNFSNEGRNSRDPNVDFSNEGRSRRSLIVQEEEKKDKKAKKAAADRETEAQRFLESLQKQLEKTRELTAVEQVLTEIQSGRIKGGLSASQAGQALDIAAQIDDRKRMTKAIEEQEEAFKSWIKVQVEAQKAASDEAKSLRESNDRFREETEVVGASAETIYLIEQARLSSAIAIKEEALAVERSKDVTGLLTGALEEQIEALRVRQGLLTERKGIEDFQESLRKASEQAAKYNDVFKSSFEDSFAGFLDGSKTAKEAFQDFAASVISGLARIAAQKAALAIFGEGGGVFDSTSSNTGWIGSLVSLFAGGKANGGYIPPGQWGMTGENGPERVFGGSTGATVVPMGKGGTTVNNVSVNMPAGASRETGMQFGAAIALQLERASARNN